MGYFSSLLGLTLIGICGANHRSEQTRRQIIRNSEQIALTNKQISLTESQNKFSNYYKHVEEFEKYCDKHSDGSYSIDRARLLYRKLFIHSKVGNYTLAKEATENFDSDVTRFIRIAEKLNTDDWAGLQEGLVELSKYWKETLSAYNLKTIGPLSTMTLVTNEGNFDIPGKSTLHLILNIILAFRKIDEIFRFDIEYKQSRILAIVDNIDLEKVNQRIVDTKNYQFYNSDIKSLIEDSEWRLKNPIGRIFSA